MSRIRNIMSTRPEGMKIAKYKNALIESAVVLNFLKPLNNVLEDIDNFLPGDRGLFELEAQLETIGVFGNKIIDVILLFFCFTC